MNKYNYVKVMKTLSAPPGLQERISSACLARRKRKTFFIRRTLMTAAAFTLVLAIIIGVPYVTKNSATGQLEGKISTGISLEARADETGEITKIFFPLTGTSEPFTNDIAPDYGGTTGNDFTIRGENIKGIDYTAESGRLMCEFESQHKGENGEYIWSSFYDGVDTEEYKARVADIENPTREELLAVAEYVDSTGRLAQLRKQMGIGKNDAINYDTIKLSGEVAYKGKSSSAFIFFENTENPPQNSVTDAKEISDVPPGDYITWLLPTELSHDISEKRHEKTDYKPDLTGYKDNIDITVNYSDGKAERYTISISFTQGSQSTMVIEKKS